MEEYLKEYLGIKKHSGTKAKEKKNRNYDYLIKARDIEKDTTSTCVFGIGYDNPYDLK